MAASPSELTPQRRPSAPRAATSDLPAGLVAELQRRLLTWFEGNGADLPWRREPAPYRVLVSEFMLQQTQRSRVAPKFLEFLKRFPSIEDLAAAPLGEVIRAWAGMGYNGRAVRLHRLARAVVESGAGIPRELEQLRALPGVGDYTARAIACFGFGAQEWVVDTNVSRVLRRVLVGDPYPKPHHRLDAQLAAEALPPGRAVEWNSALMDLGATICLARAPRCLLCPLAECCLARAQIALPRRDTASEQLRVAEGAAPYQADRKSAARASFAGSDRYLRGRIVAALRELAPGEGLTLSELALRASGKALPPEDERVARLVAQLVDEGLVAAVEVERGHRRFSLPG